MSDHDQYIGDKYYIIHDGIKYITRGKGQSLPDDEKGNKKGTWVHTKQTIELFDTVQALVDRVLELGLLFTVQDVIEAHQDGAEIPSHVIDWAKTQENTKEQDTYIADFLS